MSLLNRFLLLILFHHPVDQCDISGTVNCLIKDSPYSTHCCKKPLSQIKWLDKNKKLIFSFQDFWILITTKGLNKFQFPTQCVERMLLSFFSSDSKCIWRQFENWGGGAGFQFSFGILVASAVIILNWFSLSLSLKNLICFFSSLFVWNVMPWLMIVKECSILLAIQGVYICSVFKCKRLF